MCASGPGATNTVTGLTDAMMDSFYSMYIRPSVTRGGNDAFQEADIVGIADPVQNIII